MSSNEQALFDVGDVVRSVGQGCWDGVDMSVALVDEYVHTIHPTIGYGAFEPSELALARPARWRVGDVVRDKHPQEYTVTHVDSDGYATVRHNKSGLPFPIPPVDQSFCRLASRPGVTLYGHTDAIKAVYVTANLREAAPAVCPECKGNPAYVYVSLFNVRHNCGLCGGGAA